MLSSLMGGDQRGNYSYSLAYLSKEHKFSRKTALLQESQNFSFFWPVNHSLGRIYLKNIFGYFSIFLFWLRTEVQVKESRLSMASHTHHSKLNKLKLEWFCLWNAFCLKDAEAWRIYHTQLREVFIGMQYLLLGTWIF